MAELTLRTVAVLTTVRIVHVSSAIAFYNYNIGDDDDNDI